jgi:hypothetical protein
MKRSILTVLVSILFIGTPTVAYADTIIISDHEKQVLYYADHTTLDWRTWDADRRWNKNDQVYLEKVDNCTADLNPCATIIDPQFVDLTRWTIPRNNPRAIEALTDFEYDGNSIAGHTTIELFSWWTTERIDDTLDWRMERAVCHELGHYIFGATYRYTHPSRGCLSNNHDRLAPGKFMRSQIPAIRAV